MPPARAIIDSTAAAEGRVPLGDERLDDMLAGGLRAGELCGFYGTAEAGVGGVRRHLPDIVCHCARYTGAVFYVPLVDSATGALRESQRRLEAIKTAHPVRALATRPRDMDSITDQAHYYAGRDEIRLIVIDPFEAITPARQDVDAWENTAQVTRDVKALARAVGPIGVPVILACTTWTSPGSGRRGSSLGGGGRALPADPLVAAADILLRTNGRYPEMVKNRHGRTQLHW